MYAKAKLLKVPAENLSKLYHTIYIAHAKVKKFQSLPRDLYITYLAQTAPFSENNQ